MTPVSLRQPLALLSYAVAAASLLSGCASPSSIDGAGPAGASAPVSVPASAAGEAPTTTPTASTPAGQARPSVAPTAAPSDDSTDGAETGPMTVDQLRDGVEHAGYDCSDWLQDDAVPDASESGWCAATQIGISTYSSEASRDHVLSLSAASDEAQAFLIGSTWLVTVDSPASQGEELQTIQGVLGGALTIPGA